MPPHESLVVLEPDASGGYLADVPTLRECVTHGETVDGAPANAREAIALYLQNGVADNPARAGARGDLVFADVAIPATA